MDSTSIEIQLQALNKIKSEFNDIFDGQSKEILNSTCLYSAEQVSTHLADMNDKEKLLKIGIIGRVKAGKSSLINSLLFDGREVLPKAATPMTAALTTIGYSEQFTAQVEFFSEQDLCAIKDKAEHFKKEVDIALIEKENLLNKKKQNAPNLDRKSPIIDITKLKNSIEREIGSQFPTLKAAADLYDKIKSVYIDHNMLGQTKQLSLSSEKDLTKELYDYVGADGKYMPFTRALHLGLPVESLKDMLVVDTPGLNDAVSSREQRTYDILKECNVVFIISPSGQFLHDQDLALANRLTKREGIQEIFVVASQVDTQLHGSEKAKNDGILPDVIESIKQILAKQASKTLAAQDNEVLKNIANEQNKRFFVTSGVCHTLLRQKEDKWDPTASHVLKTLKQNYPNYFTNENDQAHYLHMLSGQAPLLNVITSVREHKNRILSEQIDNFIEAQASSVRDAITHLTHHFEQMMHKIKHTDLQTIEGKQQELQNIRQKGIHAADSIFIDEVDELKLQLKKELNQSLREFRSLIKADIDSAEGTVTETYQYEKSGVFNWIARGIGTGGYETRTDLLTAINTRIVRQSLEDMHTFIRNGLTDCTQSHLLSWRKRLNSQLINKLRGTIGDDVIDIDRLGSICRSSISQLQDLTSPDIPSLPASLTKSNKLKGYEADEYINEVDNYLTLLLKEADAYIKLIINVEIRKIRDYKLGNLLFDNLQTEIELLHHLVKNERLAIDKLTQVIKRISEI